MNKINYTLLFFLLGLNMMSQVEPVLFRKADKAHPDRLSAKSAQPPRSPSPTKPRKSWHPSAENQVPHPAKTHCDGI